MNEFFVELENDLALTFLLASDDHISRNLERRKTWKMQVEDALGDYDKPEQIKAYNWCISRLKSNLGLHLEKPLTPHITGDIDMQIALVDPVSLQYEKDRISAGYNIRIRHFEKRLALATGRNRYRLNRIKWLGTQQELAELFIQLRAKGWIDEIEEEPIKECFEKTDTIPQILKPGKFDEKYKGTFSQVFTKSYIRMFDDLRNNPNSK